MHRLILIFVLAIVFALTLALVIAIIPVQKKEKEKEQFAVAMTAAYAANPFLYNNTVRAPQPWPQFIDDLITNKKTLSAPVIVDPINRARLLDAGFASGQALKSRGCFIAIAAPARAFAMECGFDFKNKKIGVLTQTEYHFAQAICYGYRIPGAESQISYIPEEDWAHLDTNKYDIILAYIVPNSDMYRIIFRQEHITIFGFQNIDLERIAIFYPERDIQLETTDLASLFSGGRVMARESTTQLFWMSQYPILSAPTSISETFVNSLMESPTRAAEYACYGDPMSQTRQMCESSCDVSGFPRQDLTSWDARCKKDSDCPFTDSGGGGGGGGGCQSDGYCKLPIGVRRRGWRRYDGTGQFAPFCLGCGPTSSVSCCRAKGQYIFADTPGRSYISLH